MRHATMTGLVLLMFIAGTARVRMIGSPSEIIVLRGVGESTSIRGGIEVAAGSLAFLRGAQFGLAQNVRSLTY